MKHKKKQHSIQFKNKIKNQTKKNSLIFFRHVTALRKKKSVNKKSHEISNIRSLACVKI